MIKARAHLPDVNQACLLVVQPKDERAKIFAAALRIGIAANDALLTLRDFDLEPIGSALFFIAAVALLGNDALQAALLRGLKKSKTLFGIVVGKMNYVVHAGNDPVLQQLLPLLEPHAPQVETIEVEQIERIVDNRNAFAPRQAALCLLYTSRCV